jgi:NDP-sugar pyrophosphorylase family protein
MYIRQRQGIKMQMVILAGGLATRLRPITEKIPKSMVRISGKPFLQYQIDLLKKNQITDIVLCVGHLSEQIIDYFGDGRRFGVNIKYSQEKEELLGTAGAIKNAEPLLHEEFMIMYGDSYLMLDYRQIMSYFKQFDKLALMVVYKNFNQYDTSNVIVEDYFVKKYDKKNRTANMIYIDEGLSILRKAALNLVPGGQVVQLEEFFTQIIARKEMLAFETKQRFYEIGSFEGLKEFEEFITSGDTK